MRAQNESAYLQISNSADLLVALVELARNLGLVAMDVPFVGGTVSLGDETPGAELAQELFEAEMVIDVCLFGV
jgi:hypothetical protein